MLCLHICYDIIKKLLSDEQKGGSILQKLTELIVAITGLLSIIYTIIFFISNKRK